MAEEATLDVINIEVKTTGVRESTKDLGKLIGALKMIKGLRVSGSSAAKSIDKLTESVGKLNEVNTNKLKKVINTLSRLSDIKVPNLAPLTGSTKKLQNVLDTLRNQEKQTRKMLPIPGFDDSAIEKDLRDINSYAMQIPKSFMDGFDTSAMEGKMQKLKGIMGDKFARKATQELRDAMQYDFKVKPEIDVSDVEGKVEYLKNAVGDAWGKSVSQSLKDSMQYDLKIAPPIDTSTMEGKMEKLKSIMGDVDYRAKTIEKSWESVANTVPMKLLSMFSQLKDKTAVLRNNLSDAFKGGLTAAKKFFSKSTAGFKRLTKIIGLMILRKAINAMMKNIRESFIDLYRYSRKNNGEFAKSMDSIATSSLYLRNSIVTLTETFVNKFAPFFDKLVDKIADIISQINYVLAVMSGADTYEKALKFSIKFEDSLNGANASARKLKKTLLGFDEINALSDLKGNSLGTGIDPGKLFETVKIDKNATGSGIGDSLQQTLNSLALTIKDVVFDWSNLTGEQVLQKLITAFNVLLGAATGFALAGPGGAVVGSLVGLGLSLVFNSLLFDHDGKLDAVEMIGALADVAGFLVGGVIGFFATGNVTGALIGASVGSLLTMLIGSLVLKKDEKSGKITEKSLATFIFDIVGAFIGAVAGFLLVKNPAGALIGATIGTAFTMGITSLIFKDEGDKLDPEEVASMVAVVVGTLVGGVIGFVAGGAGGALLGATVGASLGVAFSNLSMDNDGQLTSAEVGTMISGALTALVGGVIGFVAGGAGGALIGATVGSSLTMLIGSLVLKKDEKSGKITEKSLATFIFDVVGAFIGAIAGFLLVKNPAGALIGATIGTAFTMGVTGLIFKKTGDELDPEEVVSMVVVVVTSLVGGVIGFVAGGAGGALLGATVGASLGVAFSKLWMDNNGQLTSAEVGTMISGALTALVGGVIGFVAGGPGGALIGATVGAALGVGLKLLFTTTNEDGEIVERQWLTDFATWWDNSDGESKNLFANVGVSIAKGWDTIKGWFNKDGKEKTLKTTATATATGEEGAKWNTITGWFSKDSTKQISANAMMIRSGMDGSFWNKISEWFSKDSDKKITATATMTRNGTDGSTWNKISKWFSKDGKHNVKATATMTRKAADDKNTIWSTITDWFKSDSTKKITATATMTRFGSTDQSFLDRIGNWFSKDSKKEITGTATLTRKGATDQTFLDKISGWFTKDNKKKITSTATITASAVEDKDNSLTALAGLIISLQAVKLDITATLKDGISKVIATMMTSVLSAVNGLIDALNKTLKLTLSYVSTPDWVRDTLAASDPDAKKRLAAERQNNNGKLKKTYYLNGINYYFADGGFPTQGDLFIANEAGPEMVGRIGNRTAVANRTQIVESVAKGVSDANREQNELLKEQNNLLRQLLNKNNSAVITTTQIKNAFNRENRRTGKVGVSVG